MPGAPHTVTGRVATALIFLAGAASACGNSGTGSTTGPTTIVAVLVAGAGTAIVGTSGTEQLSATATFSNGTTQAVTANAAWQSSNASIATVNGGLVTEQTFGQATITATYQGVSGATVVTTVPSFAGTWGETAAKSTSTVTFTLTLLQIGTTVSGAMNDIRTGASPFTIVGPFTGTVSGTTMTWSIALADPTSTCQGTMTGTATVAGSVLDLAPLTVVATGPASYCDVSVVPPANFVVALTKQ